MDRDDVIQSAEITSVQAEGLEIPSVVDKDAAIIPLEQKETDTPDSVQKDVECIEPQPSTSKELERRVSSDVPEHHDSMDLLAESTRLRADDDDQEDDDDDEDFYHDESSNLMTAEHSDESNAHTEADGTKHLHEDSNDNTQVTEERDTQEINIESSELSDETGEKEMDAAEMADKAFDAVMSSVKDVQTDEVVTDTEPKASEEGTEAVPDDLKDTAVTSEEPKSHEVFNIDSDDDTTPTASDAPSDTTATETAPQPVLRDIKCVNPLCEHPAGSYFLADAATLEFYDGGRRRALVCEECLQRVRDRQEDLMEGIRNLTPLLELNMNTYGHDLVEISDSESDGEEEEDVIVKEKLGEAGAKFVEEHLEDLFNETWRKYDMDSRLADTEMVLQMELRTLEKETKEMKSFLDECQASTDRVRNELYATFPQEAKEDPPLLIYDTPEQQYCYVQALPQSTTKLTNEAETPTAAQTRLSKRRLEATAASETPAKRPAIPLGYTPLDELNFKTESTDNKPTATPTVEIEEKVEDDDNVDVSVVTVISSESAPPGLPPPGEPIRPPLRVGMTVYAMKNSFGSWIRAKVLEVLPKGTSVFTSCRVKLENKYSKTPVLPARCLAYAEPASARMTIGTRVIALFKDTGNELRRETYYSGIVAEVPNPVNSYRYLIFFDDGYAQYASHADTRLVCECSALVWEEVHPFSREFVKEYLRTYPARPMVRLHPFQTLKTEWNGKWWTSKVSAVDASLAQVHFPVHNRYEWIYRGSTRLAPLYLELQAAERHRPRAMPRTQAHSRSHMPVVEYTRDDEQSIKSESDKQQRPQQQPIDVELSRQRAVAKKSTTSPSVTYMPPPPIRPPLGPNLDNVTSRVVYYTPKNAVKPHKMVPHTCSPKCKRSDVLALKDLRTYNPLAKPLLSGWERQIVRCRGQKSVAYRAPCGRRVRNVQELHRYLRATACDLPVDLFDFAPHTHCLAEFVLNKCLIMKKDLSQGKENVPVPCVNYYDQTLPEFCSYNTERTPTAGVPLNLDPEFLCGCDCEDDCEDKSKCACWKLTLEGARTIGLEGDNVGYVYKRLPEPLPSGIYECNSRCKCKHTCLNRVAQHPLQLKLQVFKTLNRGWGIRALNDVPKGAFLCVYAGNLLTDATANLDGLIEGDEYLAELDYIEVVEQMKEGYEEDIPEALKKGVVDCKKNVKEDEEDDDPTTEDEEESTKNESEDDDFRPGYIGLGVATFSKSLRERKKNKEDRRSNKEETEKEEPKKEEKIEPKKEKNAEDDCITISDDDEVREPSRFAAAAGMGADEFISKYRSVRALFGEDEKCYIMDAKVQGNIGRYLNHSCCPNVFVQNVFVDTHDPRFPWVAFFALAHIRAGTELTWNYNYDVGSVPGKALYCYCGAANCRGRLL
ncbi:histone-lysine N-methyltransferase eggless [Epargyreus clarus]|uniref:histone-lysine N-methyltransferase eggless n=1 Tax=Epargyreus clarus TaxID=520877 RepID=UPI003C2B0C74